MTTVHTIDEMKEMINKSQQRHHSVSKSILIEDAFKLPFPLSIVKYNAHMKESDDNAQQWFHYSPHRLDNRYWWLLLIFLLDAVVLNAFKLWRLINSASKLTHLKFQNHIVEGLLSSADRSRKKPPNMPENFIKMTKKTPFCIWEHLSKKNYCKSCKEKTIKLRKRRVLEKINSNVIKKGGTSQTKWQSKSCEPCCKKNRCWKTLHSNLKT